MAERRRLVVVGGVAAGLSAAARAKRLDPGLDVAVFERTGFCSYTACGLPYFVGGVISTHTDLVVRTPEDMASEGVSVELRHEVTGIDLGAGRVGVRDLDGGSERDEPFDELLLATGGRPRLPIEGMETPGVFLVRTVEDGIAIRGWIEERGPRRAVIVGGGYIGLEMAEALRARDVEVEMIEALPHVLPFVDEEIADDVEAELARGGVAVHLGTPVDAIEGDGSVRRVVASGAGIDADLVVVGVGVGPESRIAEDAGIPLGTHGAVAVDDHMRTAIPHLWAAGDCAQTKHLLHDKDAFVPLGTTANKQGRVVGGNIGGRDEAFAGVVGTAAVKVFDLHVARTGLSEREATAAGLDVVAATISHRSRARYFPGGTPIKVKMVAERGSGRLLGAQLAGREGVAKRIDVVAAALHGGATVDDVEGFDLSYAPPFAPVWDPLLIGARQVARMV